MKTIAVLCLVLLSACALQSTGSFTQTDRAVVITPGAHPEQRVRLEVRSDRIVRVTATADANLDLPASLMTVPSTAPVDFRVERREGELTLRTTALVAHGSLDSGAVRCTDSSGKPLVEETPVRVLQIN